MACPRATPALWLHAHLVDAMALQEGQLTVHPDERVVDLVRLVAAPEAVHHVARNLIRANPALVLHTHIQRIQRASCKQTGRSCTQGTAGSKAQLADEHVKQQIVAS